MKILGISCYYHDAAACLVIDGKIVAACEEERLTRIKHDSSYPEKSINFCLAFAKIKSSDLDAVVFYEKPFVKLERLFLSVFQAYPDSFHPFSQTVSWLVNKLWIKTKIIEHLGITGSKIHFIPHHLSHAASCFYPSGFEKAAILTNDGVGEWTTSALGVGDKTGITLFKEMRFPHSLGLLYATVTAFLGFEVNEGEYKVMGMAGYGKPEFLPEIKKLYTLYEDGSIALNLKYFEFLKSTEKMFSQELIKLLGKPRIPGSEFFTGESGYPSYYGNVSDNFKKSAKINMKYANIASSLQKATEEIILTQARYLYKVTKLNRLCMAGGVALNGVANYRIYQETPIKEIFVQPAAGDSGGAMGAALYMSRMLEKDKPFAIKDVYFGPSYTQDEIIAVYDKFNLKYKKYSQKDLTEFIVNALLKRKVVAWFCGRMEWGPRALGNRSILADPRSKKTKDTINIKIKFREPFRPFAPVVMLGKAKDYFDIPVPGFKTAAKYMTVVTKVLKDKQKEIPAVTHVDKTGRIQVIDRKTNPKYYEIVREFGKNTGTYVLLNTSFNLKGEPIVCSPEDAVSTFLRSGIDVLVMENTVAVKEENGKIVK